MIKVAFFGDIHGNHLAAEAVLCDIAQHQPDVTICLGDLVGYGAHPNETVALIQSLGIPVIMGNYDQGIGHESGDCGCAYKTDEERTNGEASVAWTAANVTEETSAYLRSLLPEHRFESDDMCVRVVHGSPRRINEYLFEDRDPDSLARIARSADCDVLVFGHTHKPWVKEIEGVLFVNAGSVGKPKDGDPRACWALMELHDGEAKVSFQRVEYDFATEAAAIRAADGLPDVYASDIETGGKH